MSHKAAKGQRREPKQVLTEKDLKHWRFLGCFVDALKEVISKEKLHPTFKDPRRAHDYSSYLSLFLLGLFNPVVESMRGICSASHFKRVEEEFEVHRMSPATFSEMQHVIDPAILEKVFHKLLEQTKRGDSQRDHELAHLNIVLQDGSLWKALPRMAWAEYGVGPKGDAKGVRLHLRFNLVADQPEAALITPGKECERKALAKMCKPGQTNVGDRYYGASYSFFKKIQDKNGFFVFRIKEDAVIHQEEPIELTQEDRKAGVVRHSWVQLGAHEHQRSIRVRLIEIRTTDQHIFLVTNHTIDLVSADMVGLIYRRRWEIELFFRWIKCILKSRHFFAESPEGVAIQMYLALIASVLFQYYTGYRPNKRMMEAIKFFMMGWASAEELGVILQRESAKIAAKKTV